MRIWPGRPAPLGAGWDGEGTNFALFSDHASAVELCLFDESGRESHRLDIRESTDRVWHAYLPDVRPGRLYGFRVHGPYDPGAGHRFNPNKLVLDPYAKAVTSPVTWDDAIFGYRIGEDDLSFDDRDSASSMPKCVVVDGAFSWGDDRRPATSWTGTIVYECHVKGLTKLHPAVPEELRGTYLGMAADPVVDHLVDLGVSAVELLPVHHHVVERALKQRALTNYWGYNSIGFFAPDVRYATKGAGEQVDEFKTLVRTLHRAGIEVILDVVYNHTAEGNHLGPTLCFRGIDNRSYYRLVDGDDRFYADVTGCGNTLDLTHPRVLQLVMDSLRYWVEDMHVDGFRFDLAPALARDPGDYNQASSFFKAVLQDPVLREVKLIAEPWDVGPGGYQVGGFPPGWAEWNGRYRDCVRRFWRGDRGQVPELASRLAGSSDLFAHNGRRPSSSVNFVTAHDGYTLHDLVSYERKHNEENGEDNRDGHNDNHSRNWGAEGPTDSTRVGRQRERMKRNFLATLILSQGTPMLLAGDELGQTQRGNNNAYCQDNEISWINWDLSADDRDLLAFTKRLLRVLRDNPVLRRRSFLSGRALHNGVKDLTWIRPDGSEMSQADWDDDRNHVLGMLLLGRASDEVDDRGRPLFGDTILLLMNGGARSRYFVLPKMDSPGLWFEILNTANPGGRVLKREAVNLVAHSLIVLRYGEDVPAT